MPSEKQIGLMEDGHMVREPELCAVTGRDVRGKHAVTHYGPDGQFVYVLAQVDHLWPQAAPVYGFPVEEEKPAENENVFVLDTQDAIESKPSFTGEFGTMHPIETARLIKDRPAPRPATPKVIIDSNVPSKGDD